MKSVLRHKVLLLVKTLTISAMCLLSSVLLSCVNEEEHFDNNAEGNFQALWKLIDEHYCFLDYKQINWDEVGSRYHEFINDDMTSDNLFEVLGDMLSELKDGHVNLYNTSNVARYWDYYQDYPRNFSEELQERYLGQGYRIAGGMEYTILEDNIGYITCKSFSSGIGEGNLNQILRYLALCQGIIIDVRGNGGGELTRATALAERFTNEKKLVGYIMHKTGKGHGDFSKPTEMYLNPSDGLRWQKPVVVLTNRHSYSATNYFVSCMRYLDGVTIVGDWTGGGSGLPFTSELPNGWGVRFSASPMLDAQGNHIEFGIEPDIRVDLKKEDADQGIDTIIEKAREFLLSSAKD